MARSATEIEGQRLKYLEVGRWWRKLSLKSSYPETCLWYAENQELLASDMETNPNRYINPFADETDWQIFQKFNDRTARFVVQ